MHLIVTFCCFFLILKHPKINPGSAPAMWPLKSFSFDGQFALITPVPIAMPIFLKITHPAIWTPVTMSFTFRRNSSSKRFGLSFLLCTVALSFFCLFQFFFPVIYWCSYKVIFRIFFPKFLQLRFCSMYQSVFANLILNAFRNWGVIILLRLSVWFYLITNDRYFCLITLPDAEDRNDGTLWSDFPLFFFVTVL